MKTQQQTFDDVQYFIDLAREIVQNPTTHNVITVIAKIQKEGGRVTGSYPITFVTQEDFEYQTEREGVLSHQQMMSLAESIGVDTTATGQFWDSIDEWANINL